MPCLVVVLEHDGRNGTCWVCHEDGAVVPAHLGDGGTKGPNRASEVFKRPQKEVGAEGLPHTKQPGSP